MVKISRFAGRSVLLTSIAIALIGGSLALPWFVMEHSISGPTTDGQVKTEFFTNHEISHGLYPSTHSLSPGQNSVMDGVVLALAGFAIAGLAFITAILQDWRRLGVLFGWFACGLGVFAAGDFAISFGASTEFDPVSHIGFLGRVSWSQGLTTHTINYYPGLGFWVVVLALILVTIAAAFRSQLYLKTPREYDEAKRQQKQLESPWEGEARQPGSDSTDSPVHDTSK